MRKISVFPILFCLMVLTGLASCGHDDPESESKSTSVTGVSVNRSSITLEVGSSETLKASVAPATAANKAVSWSSSDTGVATVDSDGKVTAVKVGSATITVTTTDGSKTASCTVTVNEKAIPVTGVTLNSKSVEIGRGDNLQLKATVSPSNATNQKITWESSNTNIATVSESGVIDALALGKVTITAYTENENIKATCEVNVIAAALPGVYWFQDRNLMRNKMRMDVNTTFCGACIDVDGNVYYINIDKNKLNKNGEDICVAESNGGSFCAAGGGFFYVVNMLGNNTSIDLYRVSDKGVSKHFTLHKGKVDHEIFVNGITADNKGNCYVVGDLKDNYNRSQATMWKLSSSGTVTVTKLANSSTSYTACSAITANQKGDVYCLVFDGTYTIGLHNLQLFKNGKKQYLVSSKHSRASSLCSGIHVVGDDVYMAVNEKGSDNNQVVTIFKNKNVLYKSKSELNLYGGNIFATKNGDVYYSGYNSDKNYIFKNNTEYYTGNKYINPGSFFVKE